VGTVAPKLTRVGLTLTDKTLANERAFEAQFENWLAQRKKD
jgi:hypothetical protein